LEEKEMGCENLQNRKRGRKRLMEGGLAVALAFLLFAATKEEVERGG
jgi:hypothetical protein